ncbi:hypothetical protein ON010_g6594 [Phytophthora cinnamomi]|nr:hypothetical protein ON010_g6594 [Phytophthora cinnamomi]
MSESTIKAVARQRRRIHSLVTKLKNQAVKMQVGSNEASTEWLRKITDALQAARDEALAGTSLLLEARPRTSRRASIENAGLVLSRAAGRADIRSFLGGRGVCTAHAGGRGRGQAVGVERRVDDADMWQLAELEEEAVIVDGMLLTLLRDTACLLAFIQGHSVCVS